MLFKWLKRRRLRREQVRLFHELVLEEVERGKAVVKASREAMEADARKLRSELRDPFAAVCPSCGSQLVVRTAVKSRTPGTLFWGCRRWPICTYTAEIESIPDPHIRSYTV
jgi:hypothetical protein